MSTTCTSVGTLYDDSASKEVTTQPIPGPQSSAAHKLVTSTALSEENHTTQDAESISKQLFVVNSEDSNTTLEQAKASDKDHIPVPPPLPKGGVSILAHKLWIGNLDKRLTEQNILKFVTQYGTVVSFRYLFKASSERVEPRGYVFVEFSTREEAETAKAGLDGKKALGRKLIVDWAKVDQGAFKKNASTVSETWDASTVSKTLDGRTSKSAKIAALEAKLRQMEESDLSSSAKRQRLSSPPIIHRHTVVTASVAKRTRPVF